MTAQNTPRSGRYWAVLNMYSGYRQLPNDICTLPYKQDHWTSLQPSRKIASVGMAFDALRKTVMF